MAAWLHCGTHSFPRANRALAGLRRARGGGADREPPIAPPMLVSLFAARLPSGSRWLATLAHYVVGVFGALRRSNLVVGAVSLAGQPKRIIRAGVEFDSAHYALGITIRLPNNLLSVRP